MRISGLNAFVRAEIKQPSTTCLWGIPIKSGHMKTFIIRWWRISFFIKTRSSTCYWKNMLGLRRINGTLNEELWGPFSLSWSQKNFLCMTKDNWTDDFNYIALKFDIKFERQNICSINIAQNILQLLIPLSESNWM